MALRREGALARTGHAQGRPGREWQWLPLPQNAPAVSQRHPLVAGAHLARSFVGEHLSRLRERFAIFSKRLCIMSHIAYPKRIFSSTQVAAW